LNRSRKFICDRGAAIAARITAGARDEDMQVANDDRSIFLSTAPPTRRDRIAALAVVVATSVAFLVALPFASVTLARVPALIAGY